MYHSIVRTLQDWDQEKFDGILPPLIRYNPQVAFFCKGDSLLKGTFQGL